MAAAIREAYGVEPGLVKGADGAFEITVDQKLIFSKKTSGRFPTSAEILELLRY